MLSYSPKRVEIAKLLKTTTLSQVDIAKRLKTSPELVHDIFVELNGSAASRQGQKIRNISTLPPLPSQGGIYEF